MLQPNFSKSDTLESQNKSVLFVLNFIEHRTKLFYKSHKTNDYKIKEDILELIFEFRPTFPWI